MVENTSVKYLPWLRSGLGAIGTITDGVKRSAEVSVDLVDEN